MSIVNLKSIIECMIFVSENPITLNELTAVLDDSDRKQITEAIEELKQDYEKSGHSFILSEVAGGYQLRTRPEFAGWVRRLLKERPTRLSRSALEVLAIISYKQPITRAGVEQLRGVDSSGTLRNLIERHFVKVIARDESAVGRPFLYGTTAEFLESFGLNSLADLPQLGEMEEIAESGAEQLELISGKPEAQPQNALITMPEESTDLDDILPFKMEQFAEDDHEAISEELADIFRNIRRQQRTYDKKPDGELDEGAEQEKIVKPVLVETGGQQVVSENESAENDPVSSEPEQQVDAEQKSASADESEEKELGLSEQDQQVDTEQKSAPADGSEENEQGLSEQNQQLVEDDTDDK
jgi:segregation and condensation protein B